VAERLAAGLDAGELQDAELLTSELVTDVVVHGCGPIDLRAAPDENRSMVEVVDHGERFAQTVCERDFDALGGRRLTIASR